MPQSREVVITGLGAVCPLGVGREAVWASLLAGRSGVRPIVEFVGKNLPFRYAGLIEGFEPKEYVQPRKTLKVMSSEIQAAYSAAMMALQDAGLAKDTVTPERLGVVLGSEMLYGELSELADTYRNCIVDGVFHHELWAEQVMKNLKAVLEAARLSFSDVVKCTIYLTDLGDFSQVNDVYGRYFTHHPPARATVQVAGLPKGARVEIDAIAVAV